MPPVPPVPLVAPLAMMGTLAQVDRKGPVAPHETTCFAADRGEPGDGYQRQEAFRILDGGGAGGRRDDRLRDFRAARAIGTLRLDRVGCLAVLRLGRGHDRTGAGAAG